MGAWGPGLWSDDTAADVRSTYREALEDGLDDASAMEMIVDAFAPHLSDPDDSGVVWLALAATQSRLGRLDPDVLARALDVIDSGSDLERWAASPAATQNKRRATLEKLRAALDGPQPARKKITRPRRPETDLQPGDVLAYRAPSGRFHLLRVDALNDTRYGLSPLVRLLDYAGKRPPTLVMAATCGPRRQGRQATAGQPAEPWWMVGSVVSHQRGSDYGDFGFIRLGSTEPSSAVAQETALAANRSYSAWRGWKEYLDRQDAQIDERGTGSSRLQRIQARMRRSQ